MDNKYIIDDLVRVAKRENNTKRRYLYVNPLQGKHMPVAPSLSLSVFKDMAKIVENRYEGKTILIIGFSETATAIGTAIALNAKNVSYYLTTTRENIPGEEYLYFSESHSHATEQRLAINGLEDVLEDIDYIVFAEDEVTTGNTIEKLITQIKTRYLKHTLKFGIISILNSMTEARISELAQQGIICDYLCKMPQGYKEEEINSYAFSTNTEIVKADDEVPEIIPIKGLCNFRTIHSTNIIKQKVDFFINTALCSNLLGKLNSKVLVLGSEEFMYPAIALGAAIEKLGYTVLTHSTTRSPIESSNDEGYPLFRRDVLDSLYEQGRKTFIYNLMHYDKVIIVTDADPINIEGLRVLTKAIKQQGNDDISVLLWTN